MPSRLTSRPTTSWSGCFSVVPRRHMTEQSTPTTDTAAPDEWHRTVLFMRRPSLDDLPELPALPPGYTLRAYAPTDLFALTTLLNRAPLPTWDQQKIRSDL